MENGGRKIKSIKLYLCGYCENNLKLVFKHHKNEIRKFPAIAVLIEHSTLGNILYDTGYSELIYKNYIVSILYNFLNKTYIDSKNTVIAKLKADSINPESINKIILSHSHPDHIGGLRLLNNYELISTQKVLNTLKNGNAFKLVFKNMVPNGDIKFTPVKPYEYSIFLSNYFEKIYDVLGDGSIIGVELNGHSDGQLGIYLPEFNILFAADACWGSDLLSKVKEMRFISRKIQSNFEQYVSTVSKLEKLIVEHPEIKIIYSHESTEEKRYE